jgi:predicted nucleic acid-binding Zn ribbon protein
MGWRPLPGDNDPGPVHVGTSVERVLRHLGAPKVDALGAVFGDWERLVGPRVAEHAAPVALSGGRLVVRADDPAWASQLRWLEQDLLARLDAALGPQTVTSIEVRVGPADDRPRGRAGRARRR